MNNFLTMLSASLMIIMTVIYTIDGSQLYANMAIINGIAALLIKDEK